MQIYFSWHTLSYVGFVPQQLTLSNKKWNTHTPPNIKHSFVCMYVLQAVDRVFPSVKVTESYLQFAISCFYLEFIVLACTLDSSGGKGGGGANGKTPTATCQTTPAVFHPFMIIHVFMSVHKQKLAESIFSRDSIPHHERLVCIYLAEIIKQEKYLSYPVLLLMIFFSSFRLCVLVFIRTNA